MFKKKMVAKIVTIFFVVSQYMLGMLGI